jgi:hypothetical protein
MALCSVASERPHLPWRVLEAELLQSGLSLSSSIQFQMHHGDPPHAADPALEPAERNRLALCETAATLLYRLQGRL